MSWQEKLLITMISVIVDLKIETVYVGVSCTCMFTLQVG